MRVPVTFSVDLPTPSVPNQITFVNEGGSTESFPNLASLNDRYFESGTLVIPPGLHVGGDVAITCNAVQVVGYGALIKASKYDSILSIEGDLNEIRGLCVSGGDDVNPKRGAGLIVLGRGNVIADCRIDRTSGYKVGSTPDGVANAFVIGSGSEDTTVINCVSVKPGYSGVSDQGARTTIDGLKVIDPGNRAYNYQGSQDSDYIYLKNVRTVAAGGRKTGFNFNGSGRIGKVVVRDCSIKVCDPYNSGSREQGCKFQNIDWLTVDGLTVCQEINEGEGFAASIAFDPGVERVDLSNCYFDSVIAFGPSRMQRFAIDKSVIGAKFNQVSSSIFTIDTERLYLTDCDFRNLGSLVLSCRSVPPHHAIRDCTFYGDSPTANFPLIETGTRRP